MAFPVLLAAGVGLQVFGRMMSNYQQAQAEARNAVFYREQANFARDAAIRQEFIAERQYTKLSGSQLSAYAKGGVDISGSALSTIAETFARKTEEVLAIRKKGDIEYKLARLRGIEAEKKSEQLQDPLYNLIQATGTVLTSGLVKG